MKEISIQEFVDRLTKENLSQEKFREILQELNIHCVKDYEIISAEFRKDNSRFFPRVNEKGIVIGGSFG